MKRIWIAILFFSLLLCACVPTPETEPVVKHDVQEMMEKAQATGAAMETSSDLYERLGAPRRYENSLSGTGGRLKVTVNADVLLPSGELPIARVVPMEFSMEQILTLLNAILPEGARFVSRHHEVWLDPDNLEDPQAKYYESKGSYARSAQKLRWAIDHWNDGGSSLYDGFYATVEEAEIGLQLLLIDQKEAPEHMDPVDVHAIPLKDGYPEDGNLCLYATVDDAVYASILVDNLLEERGMSEFRYVRDDQTSALAITGGGMKIPSEALSKADAEPYIQKLLEQLPFEGFSVTASYPCVYPDDYFRDVPCWVFYLTRSVNGVPETATGATQRVDEYDKPWGYESIRVVVDKDGVAGLEYQNPYQVTEIVLEQTNLLPFSEIEDRFLKMIPVYKNNLMDESFETYRYEYIITDIRLGLVSIEEADAKSGLLVPVWDFMGYKICTYQDGSQDILYAAGLHSFLTLNAVDGSIIDRSGF